MFSLSRKYHFSYGIDSALGSIERGRHGGRRRGGAPHEDDQHLIGRSRGPRVVWYMDTRWPTSSRWTLPRIRLCFHRYVLTLLICRVDYLGLGFSKPYAIAFLNCFQSERRRTRDHELSNPVLEGEESVTDPVQERIVNTTLIGLPNQTADVQPFCPPRHTDQLPGCATRPAPRPRPRCKRRVFAPAAEGWLPPSSLQHEEGVERQGCSRSSAEVADWRKAATKLVLWA